MTARRCNWRAVSGGWDDRGQREGPAVAAGGRRVPRLRRGGAARRERSGAARREGSALVGRGSAGVRQGFGPGGTDRRQGPIPVRREGVDQPGRPGRPGKPGHRRIGGHRPNIAGSARGMPTSARRSPPGATASAGSSRTLPGSGTARALRHGADADAAESPCPGRPCGLSPQAAHRRPGRPPRGDLDPGRGPSLLARSTLRASDHLPDALPRDSARSGNALAQRREEAVKIPACRVRTDRVDVVA